MNIIKTVSMQTNRSDNDNLEYTNLDLTVEQINKMTKYECDILYHALMNQRENIMKQLVNLKSDKGITNYTLFKKLKHTLQNKKKILSLLQQRFGDLKYELKQKNIRQHAIDNPMISEIFKRKVKELVGDECYKQLWYEARIEYGKSENV